MAPPSRARRLIIPTPMKALLNVRFPPIADILHSCEAWRAVSWQRGGRYGAPVMAAGIAAFVFGLLAGFVMLRLGRRKRLSAWERRVMPPLGWVLMAASITFAVALLGWSLLFGGEG